MLYFNATVYLYLLLQCRLADYGNNKSSASQRLLNKDVPTTHAKFVSISNLLTKHPENIDVIIDIWNIHHRWQKHRMSMF